MMRDGSTIEGMVRIGEDMPLTGFLNGRRAGWMNLTNARRPRTEEAPGHMMVQCDHVVMASAPDGNMLVAGHTVSGADHRPVEVVLVGGKTVRGNIPAASKQRLSDYVVSAGRFMGLNDAILSPDGPSLGDVALHTGAIALVRDLRGAATPDHEG
jgi:hypothetical protein